MSDVDDHEPFGDGEEEDVSGAEDDFEEDGEDEIDDGDVVAVDPMATSIQEQRNEDVIDVERFSDAFEPEEDEIDDCSEPRKEKLREAWRKIQNKINRGEKYATTTANVRKGSDARYVHKQWAIKQAAEGMAFKDRQEALYIRSRGTLPVVPVHCP